MRAERGLVVRHLPIAVVLGLLLQAGSAIWWASARERETVFLARRVDGLESGFARVLEGHGKMLEKLARIEERVDSQVRVLERMEKRGF